jgi:hypothetical protein
MLENFASLNYINKYFKYLFNLSWKISLNYR